MIRKKKTKEVSGAKKTKEEKSMRKEIKQRTQLYIMRRLDRNDMTDKENIKYTFQQLEAYLTYQQKRFCQEYVTNGWNASKAYGTVYSTSRDNTRWSCGSYMTRLPRIKQYIDFIKEDYEILCGISKARQIMEYSKIAYSSIADLHDTWIQLKDFKKLTEQQKQAIETIEYKTDHKVNSDKELIEVHYVKIKLHNKIAALEKIDALMGYKTADKIKMETDMNFNTGSVDTIREAFGLNQK